ncbi:SDR family NAD(P)-dependent oxidoreductase [Amycolatopsis taiwanensis]|uniref:Short-chain dehydrogenase n=1 Tax=Amycolatopsis taiwanensis TaxID=342230 RepID=A0A9W6R917_9PSEU|nr:SDR family oxidoreductase [Amycolatopsis taiwanensis]GLY70500.1 short-chain dehydrogenase [Amycolatopsis taiwanensis]
MAGRFDGTVAVVFGAARPPGIGRATALRLAGEGALVACLDHTGAAGSDVDTTAVSRAALEAVVGEIIDASGTAIGIPVDTTDEDSVRAGLAEAERVLGPIGAGAYLGGGTGPGNGALLRLPLEEFDATIRLNLRGALIAMRGLAGRMPDGGAIVALSSHAVRSRPATFGAFAAAKAGVESLVGSLARELAASGVRVNAVSPLGIGGGAVNPGLAATAGGSPPMPDWISDRIPLGRLQSADETAAAVTYLLSEDASFITGQTLSVTGGA